MAPIFFKIKQFAFFNHYALLIFNFLLSISVLSVSPKLALAEPFAYRNSVIVGIFRDSSDLVLLEKMNDVLNFRVYIRTVGNLFYKANTGEARRLRGLSFKVPVHGVGDLVVQGYDDGESDQRPLTATLNGRPISFLGDSKETILSLGINIPSDLRDALPVEEASDLGETEEADANSSDEAAEIPDAWTSAVPKAGSELVGVFKSNAKTSMMNPGGVWKILYVALVKTYKGNKPPVYKMYWGYKSGKPIARIVHGVKGRFLGTGNTFYDVFQNRPGARPEYAQIQDYFANWEVEPNKGGKNAGLLRDKEGGYTFKRYDSTGEVSAALTRVTGPKGIQEILNILDVREKVRAHCVGALGGAPAIPIPSARQLEQMVSEGILTKFGS